MKRKTIAIISCSAIFAACVSGLFLNNFTAKASTKSLFYTDGVELTTHQQLPVDKITGDNRYGLQMTADHDGESVTYASNVRGKFEMDFAVFSQDSFSGNALDAVYSNTYADIQELSVCFTDLENAENSFELVLNAGYAGNVVTPNARIRARGQEAGIYNSGRNFSQQTAAYNAKGLYTAIEGASFSNRAYILNSVTSEVKSIIKSLNASYIGTTTDDRSRNVVYGLSDGEIINELIILAYGHKGFFSVIAISGEIPHDRLEEISQIRQPLK